MGKVPERSPRGVEEIFTGGEARLGIYRGTFSKKAKDARRKLTSFAAEKTPSIGLVGDKGGRPRSQRKGRRGLP